MARSYQNNRGEKPLFLVVEDHAVLRSSLRDLLSNNFQGCRILEAKNGEEAVAFALEHNPDIVLMDIVLPQMNGIEATRRIKTNLPRIHVVIITIHENPEYKAEANTAGASAFILKRRMGAELIPTLEQLLLLKTDTNSAG